MASQEKEPLKFKEVLLKDLKPRTKFRFKGDTLDWHIKLENGKYCGVRDCRESGEVLLGETQYGSQSVVLVPI